MTHTVERGTPVSPVPIEYADGVIGDARSRTRAE